MTLNKETLRKVQLLELHCLNEVKRICENNNIPYFLIGGTLIGAVRNKGFIPWDDDIDIGMLRSDYETFCKIAPEQINKDKFFFQTPETEKNCADYGLIRIRLNNTKFVQEHRQNLDIHHGIFIEIFPYDDLPENANCNFYYNKFKLLKKLTGIRMGYKYKVTKNPVLRTAFYLFCFISRIIPLKVLKNKLKSYYLKYYQTNSTKVFLMSGAYHWQKESHLRSTVSEYCEVEFEGQKYPAPKNFNLFLSEQYGDYMTPPPVAEQINKCIVTELDFGDYYKEA